jgi:F-box domain
MIYGMSLPFDLFRVHLMNHIFYWPVGYIGRLRRVCKSWRSYLDREYFNYPQEQRIPYQYFPTLIPMPESIDRDHGLYWMHTDWISNEPIHNRSALCIHLYTPHDHYRIYWRENADWGGNIRTGYVIEIDGTSEKIGFPMLAWKIIPEDVFISALQRLPQGFDGMELESLLTFE